MLSVVHAQALAVLSNSGLYHGMLSVVHAQALAVLPNSGLYHGMLSAVHTQALAVLSSSSWPLQGMLSVVSTQTRN